MGGTKLKNLKLNSVDLVQRGANPDADICFFKSAGADKVSQEERMFKKLFDMFKSAFTSSTAAEDDHIDQTIGKGALTFGNIKNTQETYDLLWQYNNAFDDSMRSIARDTELDASEKLNMLETSLNQFTAAMRTLFPALASINTNNDTATAAKSAAVEEPQTLIKGESDDMKFDTSKMSADELAKFEELRKKFAVEDTQGTEPAPAAPAAAPTTTEPAVQKSEPAAQVTPTVQQSTEPDPVLKSALAEVQELKKALEMQGLRAVAKKYVLLGKDEEQLANTLYDLKKSGQANYDAYVAILDESLALVEKSGVFGEVGKNTHGSNGSDVVAKVEGIAKGYRDADPTLDYNTSMMRAWENNPQLLAEYEKGAI